MAPIPWTRYVTVAGLAGLAAVIMIFLWLSDLQPRDHIGPVHSHDPRSNEIPAESHQANNASTIGRLHQVRGTVQVLRANEEVWESMPQSTPVSSGDQLQTAADSMCELITSNGGLVRIDQSSRCALVSPQEVSVQSGRIWCKSGEHEMRVLLDPKNETTQVQDTTSTKSAVVELPAQTGLSCSSTSALTSFVCFGERATLREDDGTVESLKQWDEAQLASPTDHSQLIRCDPNSVNQGVLDAILWQLPLMIESDDFHDLILLLKNVLVDETVGDIKLSYFYESQIRDLGPSGALPLLAYVESETSKGLPVKRLRGMNIACDIADRTSIDRLHRLSKDSDAQIRELANQTLDRLR